MQKLLTLITIVIVLFVTGCANGESEEGSNDTETIEFSVGTGTSEDHPYDEGLEKMEEVLDEESEGRFDVQVYDDHSAGSDREMVEGLEIGTLDAALPSVGVVTNFVPEFEILNLPFLFPDEEVADEVLGGPQGDELLAAVQEENPNLIGVDYWEQGFLLLTNSSHEVETVDDMSGLNIRSIENEIQLETLRALGVNPTPMDYAELFTAMQQGVVDGQQNPISNIYADNFYEVQDYITMTEHVYGPSIFLVSESFMDQLSDEDQDLVEQAIEAGNEEAKSVMREENEEELQEMEEEHDVTVTELEESDLEEMEQAVQPVIDEYSEQIGTEFVDSFYQAIEDAQ